MSAEPSPPPRIGHKEREQAVAALADHYAHGRLDGDEYSQRVARAWEVRTTPELAALFADLPDPRPYAPPAYPPAPAGQPWPVPVMGAMDPTAPFGREPGTGRPYSDKQKVVAGLLQIFLPFGIGRFYTGHTGMAVAQLLVTFVTLGFGALWSFIDGIVIVAGNPDDPHGRPLRP